tara:strand:+ start:427 stop:1197 length:771 start_codon:yes stop_codon:yes gene_type:complete
MDPFYNHQFAIYVMSCDKTSDVCKHFIKAYKKKTNFNYKIFIGTNKNFKNSKLLNAIPLSVIKSGWKNESIAQLNMIKKKYPKIKKILIFLDDFIIREFNDNGDLEYYVKEVFKRDLSYLMFRRIRTSFIDNLVNYPLVRKKIYKIPKSNPYQCSLQVAIWDINYLLKKLDNNISMWDFEKQKSNKNHYFVSSSPLKYLHVVEKGKWLFNAKSVCIKSCGYFKQGSREVLQSNVFIIKRIITRFLVFLFGEIFVKK